MLWETYVVVFFYKNIVSTFTSNYKNCAFDHNASYYQRFLPNIVLKAMMSWHRNTKY